jgi:hypothetical protein
MTVWKLSVFALTVLMMAACGPRYALVRDGAQEKHPLSSKFHEMYMGDSSGQKVKLSFNGEDYYLSEAQETDLKYGLEFTKDGTISPQSEDIVTVCRLKYKNNYNDYLLFYLDGLKRNNDNIKFEIYKNNNTKYQKEMIFNISILNMGKKLYERCIYRLCQDEDGILYSFAYSKKYFFSDVTDDDSARNNKSLKKMDTDVEIGNWLSGITKIDFTFFE